MLALQRVREEGVGEAQSFPVGTRYKNNPNKMHFSCQTPELVE